MSSKILIIDDSSDVHTLIKIRLGKEPVTLHFAFSGDTGYAAAREIEPDLILLDLDMPDRDGFSVCTDLKSDPATMHIPVIFLTGTNSTQDKIRGLDMGAIDYITKPFDPAELRARIRASLRTNALVDLLAKKALIDGLTGLWNRAHLDARLVEELSSARRHHTPLSCIMADLDHFKSVNDSYGHRFGDEALRLAAAAFTANCRAEDVVCRYGGEEFAILLPNTACADAAELAERLRLAVETIPLMHHEIPVTITCSFGVANLGAAVPPSVIDLADQALYQAKREGRNRVEFRLPEEYAPAVPAGPGIGSYSPM
jgi:diguanylate cyclase (GGDEF)-like protein